MGHLCYKEVQLQLITLNYYYFLILIKKYIRIQTRYVYEYIIGIRCSIFKRGAIKDTKFLTTNYLFLT